MSTYTFSLWFKLLQSPVDLGRQMTLVSAKPNSLDCFFTRNFQLQCTGDKGGSLSMSGNIRLDNWYIMVLRSSQNLTELKIIDLAQTIVGYSDQRAFFPTGTTNMSLSSLTIGIDDDQRSYGFLGNLRNIRLFENFYDDQTIYKIQFIYLLPQKNIKIQIFLNSIGDYFNEAGEQSGKIIGYDPIEAVSDNMGIIQCSYKNQSMYNQYLREAISMTYNMKFKTYSLEMPQYYNQVNQESSLQVWFLHRRPTSTVKDEILFLHTNSMRLSFNKSDYSVLQIDSFLQVGLASIKLKVPYNQWMFLQVSNSLQFLNATLFNQFGTQLTFLSTPVNITKTVIASPLVILMDGFNGYSFGFKYYKAKLPVTNGFQFFKQINETNSTVLLFILMNSSTKLNTTSFKNYAGQRQALQIDPLSSINFIQTYFRDNSTITDKVATIDEDMKFDGYTCIDEKEKLFFPKTDSYASAVMKLQQSTDSYTVEFWIKSIQGITGENYMLSITDNPRNATRQHLSILQDTDNLLSCYPSQNTSPLRVRYLDYSKDSRSWIHIACVYDGKTLQMRGQLYQSKNEMPYFTDIQTGSNAMNLSSQEFIIYINSNSKTLIRGTSQSYYAEVRFWSTARSFKQIQTQRFQQMNSNEGDLVFYSKLFSGIINNQQNDIDYISQNPVTGKSVSWQADSELQICPLRMFKPQQQDSFCYRDNLISVTLIAYRTQTSYIVTSYFSNFRSLALRDSATKYFNYKWSVGDISTNQQNYNSTAFKKALLMQDGSQNLEFNLTDVADSVPGKYSLSMTISDKVGIQDSQSGKLSLITLRCANIYDRISQQSFVYHDLTNQRGVEDAKFSYNFTDCPDYKLDQNLMTFTIDGQNDLPTSDHNFSAKQFTLSNLYQQNLPINDYFYLRIKAVWKNVKNQFDQITYYLIYACRFPTILVVKIQASSILLFKGQTLQISAQADFKNAVIDSSLRTYTTQWLCPGSLNTYCLTQQKYTSLKFTNDLIDNYNYQYWMPQTFTFLANTTYQQADGNKYSNKSIDITWLDFSKDLSIKANNQINRQLPFNWQISEVISQPQYFNISWDITPVLSNNICLLNFANRTQYTINSTCLQEGQNYTVTLKLIFLPLQTQVVKTSLNFTAPRYPWGGKLTCNATNARAFEDIVNCTASGWQATNTSSLKYQFFIRDQYGGLSVQSQIQTNRTLITSLSPTSEVIVKVTDQNQQSTQTSFPINVTYVPPTPPPTPVPPPTSPNSTNSSNSSTPETPPVTPPVTPPSTPPGTPPVTPPTTPPGTPPPDTPSVTPPTTSPTTPPGTPSPPPAPLPPISDLIKESDWLTATSSNSTTAEISAKVQSLTNGVSQQISRLNELNTTDEKATFVYSAVQIYRQLSSDSSTDQSNLKTMQIAIGSLIQDKQALDLVYGDKYFTDNLLNMQSNVLEVAESTNQSSNLSQTIRNNLVSYEQYLGPKLYDGEKVDTNTSSFNFQILKISNTGSNQSTSDVSSQGSKDVNFTFPLSSASSSTMSQSLTVVNFNVTPFAGATLFNQTLLTNSTLYFAYRDENGTYLNNTFIKDRILMSFSYPLKQNRDLIKGSISCAYTSLNEIIWNNEECSTELNYEKDIVTCRCKHMSFYTIIDNSFNRTIYEQQLQKSEEVFTIKIVNWVFFIPIVYLVLVFFFGIIYTNNKDHVDFRFITDQDELVNDMHEIIKTPKDKNNLISLMPLIFHRKITFSSFGKGIGFCSFFQVFFFMLHPLFQLKYRMDPTIPRVYKFIVLFTKLSAIYCLTFVFLRNFEDFEYIAKKPQDEMTYEFIYLGISLLICSVILIPIPIFLFGCCRSKFYLQQGDKFTEEGGSHSSLDGKPKEISKQSLVQIDPSIPIKLLFLLNASSHEKIAIEKEHSLNFASGNLGAVGLKLIELDKEQLLIDLQDNSFQIDDNDVKVVDKQLEKSHEINSPNYKREQLTEMDLIRNQDLSSCRPLESQQDSIIRKSSPDRNKSVTPQKQDTAARYITFANDEMMPSKHSRSAVSMGQAQLPIKHQEITLQMERDRYKSVQKNNMSMNGGSGLIDKQSNHKDRSFRSSNRISQTEENDFEEFKKGFEGGDKEKKKIQQIEEDRSKEESSVISSNIINNLIKNQHILYDDDMQHESGISIDSNMVAADDIKELKERRGSAIIGRIISLLILIGFNLAMYGYIGYLYYTEEYYNHENNYTWVVIFFASQIFGFLIIDLIVILFITLIVTKCCCKNKKRCLSRLMRESMYIYEDYNYVVQFSHKEVDQQQ